MDTRQKIIGLAPLPAHLAGGNWRAVAGTFDPLTLAQTQRFAGPPDEQVLALVHPADDTLLDVHSRAALVAALRQVTLVVIAPRADWQPALAPFPAILVDDDRHQDRTLSEEFTQFILRRHLS